VIENHDVVGNIVSTAERAPRCLTGPLAKLRPAERSARLNMLILLSFCDLRGTLNGRFVNNDNARSRFLAADIDWLGKRERDLFGWRKERLVRGSTPRGTRAKQQLWEKTFSRFQEDTKKAIRRHFGHNIKIFTNFLYLALGLSGEQSAKLLAIISLMAEMGTEGRPNLDFQVDFTKGAERERNKPTPIMNRFNRLLKKIPLDDLVISKIQANYKNDTIYGIRISVSRDRLVIDSGP
jgi:hypothetical protein